MARQNVGNPKFYIDYLSYWKAKGNIESVTYGDADSPEKLIGLNPSDYIYGTQIYPHNIEIDLRQSLYIPTESDDKFFMGFFGHNYEDTDVESIVLSLYNSGGSEVYNVGGEQAASITINEICNWGNWDTTRYNGWSMGEWTGGDWDDFNKLVFAIDRDNTEESINALGSIAFGYAYQMPHSPNLELTMTREYDGVQEQETIGGASLTQINYHSAANWVGQPAWELFTEEVETLIDEGMIEYRDSAKGRRIWNLKFSYIGGDDILPLNQNIWAYNPSDSDTNSLADYDDDDFTDGNFISDIRRDSSFIGVVMEKTIGGALPFIFQPDGNNNSPDQFAICKLDQSSFKFKQVAHNVYDISLKIREVW